MIAVSPKEELMNWIKELDDKEIIDELLSLKKRATIEERFMNGLTIEQAKEKSKMLMREWWRKGK